MSFRRGGNTFKGSFKLVLSKLGSFKLDTFKLGWEVGGTFKSGDWWWVLLVVVVGEGVGSMLFGNGSVPPHHP